MKTLFLDVLKRDPSKEEPYIERAPVWLMRQAGRSLPSYLKLREKYSIEELLFNPELAAKVTNLPKKEIDPDALILFSDILMMAKPLGMELSFTGKGPLITPGIKSVQEIDTLRIKGVEETLSHVRKTIHYIKEDLDRPLIGFCGGPFTVATYLIDQGKSKSPIKTLNWLYSDPKRMHHLLDTITKLSIDYLLMQIDAGVDAVQIFDSWADSLTLEGFKNYSLFYLNKIIQAVKETGVPTMVFCRGSSFRAKELSSLEPDAISFDWQRPLSDIRKEVPSHIALQGNIDPHLLLSPPSIIEKEMDKFFLSIEGEKKLIVNLGHGVLPQTPVSHVRCFVDCVKKSALLPTG